MFDGVDKQPASRSARPTYRPVPRRLKAELQTPFAPIGAGPPVVLYCALIRPVI